jgi:hypothetical protein
MLKLVFALVVLVDGVEEPDVSYWKSIYRCNEFSEAVEKGLTRPHNRWRWRNNSQVNITAYCKPVYVSGNVEVFD